MKASSRGIQLVEAELRGMLTINLNVIMIDDLPNQLSNLLSVESVYLGLNVHDPPSQAKITLVKVRHSQA